MDFDNFLAAALFAMALCLPLLRLVLLVRRFWWWCRGIDRVVRALESISGAFFTFLQILSLVAL